MYEHFNSSLCERGWVIVFWLCVCVGMSCVWEWHGSGMGVLGCVSKWMIEWERNTMGMKIQECFNSTKVLLCEIDACLRSCQWEDATDLFKWEKIAQNKKWSGFEWQQPTIGWKWMLLNNTIICHLMPMGWGRSIRVLAEDLWRMLGQQMFFNELFLSFR